MVGIIYSNFDELPNTIKEEVKNKFGVDEFNFSSMSGRTAEKIAKFVRSKSSDVWLYVKLDDRTTINTDLENLYY